MVAGLGVPIFRVVISFQQNGSVYTSINLTDIVLIHDFEISKPDLSGNVIFG